MKIEHLCDHPDAITELARWYVSQWGPYYGDNGPGNARADLEARLSREELPVGLVALEGDRVLATAALGLDATTNLAPSVIGLLVRPEHRGRGIGTALVQTCLDVARNLGLPCVYISTSVLGSMLERTGWHKMGEARFLNDERGSVYVRDL